jgi:SAM-dependent methyltransferase
MITMENLSLDQLKNIPWISRFNKGPEMQQEPPLEEIPDLLKLPFMKRPGKYDLFYLWAEMVGLVPQKRLKVLDCACGLGQISQALWFKGHEVYACDLENYFKGSEEISFTQTDLNKVFPYPSQSFDAVIIAASLHYLDNQKHFFNESQRILKPGGSLIFSVPNLMSLYSKLFFVEKGQLFDYSNINRSSVLYAPFFKQYLEEIGFELECITGSTPITPRRLQLFRILNYLFLKKTGNKVEDYSSWLIYKYRKIKMS